MELNLSASHSVVIPVPEAPIPVQHYLRQPQRLVYALTDRSRVERLSPDCFRLTMRPRQFLALSFQPVVDMQVWTEPNGTVHLQSTDCEIRGVDYINNRFNLTLHGILYPSQVAEKTQLIGKGDVTIDLELPPLFALTPRPILEATSQSLLQGIFLTFKQRLGHQLITDYRHWATAAKSAETVERGNRLSANPSSF